jgi:hypothetical protein
MEGSFVLAGVLIWAGGTMSLDKWARSHWPALVDRVRGSYIADEAEHWLNARNEGGNRWHAGDH